MSTTQMNAQISLIDDKVKMEASVPGKPPVIMDYFPPIGRGEGYAPLELLLISLGTCFATTVKSILTSHLQKQIRGLSVLIQGEREKDHPTKFHTIVLSLNIDSPDLQMDELTYTAKIAEEKYCPVWAMLEGNVSVKTVLTVGEKQMGTAAPI